MPQFTTKSFTIQASKEFRQRLDAVLQDMKEHRNLLIHAEFDGEQPAEGKSEVIAQHTLSVRDLESAIMRQGMTLKAIGNPTPYPASYDPTSPVVHPMADTATSLDAIAGKMYSAYCEAVGGKAFNGDTLPAWPEFRADPTKTKQSDAWIKAAQTTIG